MQNIQIPLETPNLGITKKNAKVQKSLAFFVFRSTPASRRSAPRAYLPTWQRKYPTARLGWAKSWAGRSGWSTVWQPCRQMADQEARQLPRNSVSPRSAIPQASPPRTPPACPRHTISPLLPLKFPDAFPSTRSSPTGTRPQPRVGHIPHGVQHGFNFRPGNGLVVDTADHAHAAFQHGGRALRDTQGQFPFPVARPDQAASASGIGHGGRADVGSVAAADLHQAVPAQPSDGQRYVAVPHPPGQHPSVHAAVSPSDSAQAPHHRRKPGASRRNSFMILPTIWALMSRTLCGR